MQPLTSERLRLRPFTIDDADCLAELTGDALVSQCVSLTGRPFDQEAAATYILTAEHGLELRHSLALAIQNSAEGRLMGEVRLDVTAATLSYWLGAQFRGRGYMVEAIQSITTYAQRALKMRSVIADVVRENIASRQVLEKSGFRFQFLHREMLQPPSKSVTCLRYKLAL